MRRLWHGIVCYFIVTRLSVCICRVLVAYGYYLVLELQLWSVRSVAMWGSFVCMQCNGPSKTKTTGT